MSRAGQRQPSALASALALAQRRLLRAAALLVALLILVAYLPLRHSDYAWDDRAAVEENPIVTRGDPVEIFSTSYRTAARGTDRGSYRPVTVLAFALERRLIGAPDALVSHALNMGLHLLCCLALLALARRLGFDPFAAAAAALIFAVHPIHVEAVAGIVGRAEILAALFSLAGLLALSHSGRWRAGGATRDPGGASARLAAWSAALLLFLGLGANEVALATPLLYVALELLFRPRGERTRRRFVIERAAALAPSVLAGVVYLILRTRALETLFALQRAHPTDNPLLQLEGARHAGTALGLVARYARLLFYPVGLSADYSGPVIESAAGLFTVRAVAGTLILLACLALALRPLAKRSAGAGARRWAFAALLLLLPYLVIGNLFFHVGTIFAERMIYLPSTGFCLMAGLLLGAIASGAAFSTERDGRAPAGPRLTSSRAAIMALSALVAGFMVLTWARARDWRDDETLFRASAQAQPRSPRAHYIVGKTLSAAHEDEEARHWLDRAIALDPTHGAAWNAIGVVHARRDELALAEETFREAVRLDPTCADAHFNLGATLRRQGRIEEAERSLRRALLWDPGLASAWAELGDLYVQMGRYEPAARAYGRAITLGQADLRPRLREARRLAREGGAPS